MEAELFAAALGLQSPWYVSGLDFSASKKNLDIHIDFEAGGLFPCPNCGSPSKAYDSTFKSWRHLDFFQHNAHLKARVPRVACSKGCGTQRVEVPWTWLGSGFTLLFESLLLTLCKEMPVAKAIELIGDHDARIWRMLHHCIDKGRSLPTTLYCPCYFNHRFKATVGCPVVPFIEISFACVTIGETIEFLEIW